MISHVVAVAWDGTGTLAIVRGLYDDWIVERGRKLEFLLIVSFLASFLAIRGSTRLMRSPRVPWWPGSVTPGGLHIHHLVFGIVMMMLSGYLMFAFAPTSPWVEVLAVVFGVGAGLTMDEFALWVYLDDVYWTEEGRSSVDAFIVASLLAVLVLLAGAPLKRDIEPGHIVTSAITVGLSLTLCAISCSKGKPLLALTGLFVPPVQVFAVVRLARPGSWWARRRYGEQTAKLAKATARAEKWAAWRLRVLDALGGRPHLERETRE